MLFRSGDHQVAIYAAGMFAGQVPTWTTDLTSLEPHAAEVLAPEALGYIVPSAGGGSTARANVAAFERWRRVACRGDAKFLFMTVADLTSHGAEIPSPEDFPDQIAVGSLRVPLTYAHKVGDETDGVTIRLPVEALGQLDVKRLDWLLPGHLREKIETILRNLPKDFRRVLPGAGPLVEKFQIGRAHV